MSKINVKTLRKYLKEIVILALGIALIMISNIVPTDKNTTDKNEMIYKESNKIDDNNKISSEYFTEYYTSQIKQFVSSIEGVSNVNVIVHIDSTDNIILAENVTSESEKITEKDSNGGSRDTLTESNNKEFVIIKDSNGNEEIVVLSNHMPTIVGVAIRADGCQSYVIQEKIINAIKNTYGLKASQIYVCW
ncbi:MAG: hypothetical protein E7385_05805 [Ruminococcaceae bacterium]|nr:hypothetical protein [Oscillospiraceae bacterium]